MVLETLQQMNKGKSLFTRGPGSGVLLISGHGWGLQVGGLGGGSGQGGIPALLQSCSVHPRNATVPSLLKITGWTSNATDRPEAGRTVCVHEEEGCHEAAHLPVAQHAWCTAAHRGLPEAVGADLRCSQEVERQDSQTGPHCWGQRCPVSSTTTSWT